MLNPDVPLLNVRRGVRRLRATLPPKPSFGSVRLNCWQENRTLRQSGSRRDSVRTRSGRGEFERKFGDAVQRVAAAANDGREEDAVPSADDGRLFTGQVVGKAESRGEVFRRERRKVLSGSRQDLTGRKIECGTVASLVLQPRIQVVADSKVKRQPSRYFPVILEVGAVRVAVYDLPGIFHRVLRGIGNAEQETGKCIASARRQRTGKRRLGRAECEVSVVIARLKIRQTVKADLAACLDTVSASDDRDVVDQ